LLFIACSTKDTLVKKHVEIDDLVRIPQNVDSFTAKLDVSKKTYTIQQEYNKHYFSVWNIDEPSYSLEDIKWPFSSFKAGNSYGENLKLIEKEFFIRMQEEANFDSYATINRKAITIKDVNIRAFPTIKPLFRNPSRAGEGFPFDYLQNSSLMANKPIFISHYSKDRAWVYIFSSFASGWIKSDAMVYLKSEDTQTWQKQQQIFFIKENIPLYTEDGDFLFYSKIGMRLALESEDDESFTVLAVSTYKKTEAIFKKIKISKEIARKNILNLERDSLAIVMKELIKTKYGWGGMYGQRDCSSTLRDLYAPFNIWLPRNSSKQAKIGKVIDLENLSDEEKIATIKEKAIPFQTLLYKRGHIMLFVGTFNEKIVIFHNTWGIKTMKDDIEGRVIIGKTIFSTLRVGKNLENYDIKSQLLKNIKSMNILTQ